MPVVDVGLFREPDGPMVAGREDLRAFLDQNGLTEVPISRIESISVDTLYSHGNIRGDGIDSGNRRFAYHSRFLSGPDDYELEFAVIAGFTLAAPRLVVYGLERFRFRTARRTDPQAPPPIRSCRVTGLLTVADREALEAKREPGRVTDVGVAFWIAGLTYTYAGYLSGWRTDETGDTRWVETLPHDRLA